MSKKGAVFTKTEFAALIAKNPGLLSPEDTQNSGLGASVAASEPKNGPGQRTPGRRRKKMNRTETEFSLRLERMKTVDRDIIHWGFEEITLRWGTLDPIQYTPDFTVIAGTAVGNRHIFIEVKAAHIRNSNAAIQKFKAARNQFPHYEFQLWQKKNGEWKQLY